MFPSHEGLFGWLRDVPIGWEIDPGCWSTADRFGPQSTQVRQHVFQSTASEPNTIAALGVSDRLYSMAPCLASCSQLNAAVQPALYYERDPA